MNIQFYLKKKKKKKKEKNNNNNEIIYIYILQHARSAGQLLANFFLSLVKVPDVFAKLNSAQFPFRY